MIMNCELIQENTNKPYRVVGGGNNTPQEAIKLCQAGLAVTDISKDIFPDLQVRNEKTANLICLYQTDIVKSFAGEFAATNSLRFKQQKHKQNDIWSSIRAWRS